MPIPSSRGSAAPAPSAALSAGAQPARSTITVLGDLPALESGPSYPPLPSTPIFAYFADPTSVQFVDGEAVYRPVKVPFEAGIQGVRDGSGVAASIEYETRTNRRILIPLDRPCVAWGQSHGGYVQRIDLAPDRRGKARYHHADVWTRYDVVGSQVHQSFDQDGWLDFCRGLVDLLGPPHPGVVSGTRAQVVALADAHRRIGHASPGMEKIAAAIESSLTPKLP